MTPLEELKAAFEREQARMREMHKAGTYSPKELYEQRDRLRAAQSALKQANG